MSADAKTNLTIKDLYVGQKFVSREYKITTEEIIEFARKYDPQPFHLDEEMARKSMFRGLAASGWMTGAITMRLIVESIPIAGGLIGAGVELSWPMATRPGDVLKVESEILEVHPSTKHPSRGTAMVQVTTYNQDGKAVQLQKAKLAVAGKALVEQHISTST